MLFILGLFFVAFGPNYSYLLLNILYTDKYSSTSAPTVLAWYCLYVFCMGINGMRVPISILVTEVFAV
jgi:oligosaccharide translocation protein RFT1